MKKALWFTAYFCTALICFPMLFIAIVSPFALHWAFAFTIPPVVFISYVCVSWTLDKATD